MAYLQVTSGGTVVALTNPPLSVSYKREKSSFLLVKNSSSRSATADPLASTLVECQIVATENVEVLENVASVSKYSLKKAFMKCLQQTNKEGIFIFSYTGPAAKLGEEHSLVLSDFTADNPVTHVTPATLLEWLSEANSTQPVGYALFILDCPFSKEISSALSDIREARTPLGTQLFVVGTVNGDVTTVVLTALDCQSILHYFLSWVIRSTQFTPGSLPLKSILEKAVQCTTALSSLVVTYDHYKRILKQCTINPTTKFLQRLPANMLGQEDETDSVGKLDFLTSEFDKRKPIMNVESKVSQWLYVISDVGHDDNPLKVLFESGALTGKDDILLAVICSLLYSIASIQVAQGKPQSITEPNMFIIAFVNAIATVQIVQREISDVLDMLDACKRSWEYYCLVVTQNRLKDDHLKVLYHKIGNKSSKIS